MKKIFLLFSFLLMISMNSHALNVEIDTLKVDRQENNLAFSQELIKEQITKSLSGIKLVNNEYIVISGEILENGKFQNFKIVQMNLADARTNIIINKLISSNLAINDKYNLEKKFVI